MITAKRGSAAQAVEHLLYKWEALISNTYPTKLKKGTKY
jgi:hypothetical protein